MTSNSTPRSSSSPRAPRDLPQPGLWYSRTWSDIVVHGIGNGIREVALGWGLRSVAT
jgi:hypothetical protein